MSRSYTPPLAYPALTPLYDLALELLGFGVAFKAQVARLAEVGERDTVLDLGCGTGSLLRALLVEQPNARYTGLDPDLRALNIAAQRLRKAGAAGQITLLQGHAEHLPMPDHTHHLVISTLTFHHLSDQAKQQAISEVRRVLRPNGRFLLVDFGPADTHAARALLTLGSVFDGRENMRANLSGKLPALLHSGGFTTAEITRSRRGLRYLLCRPGH